MITNNLITYRIDKNVLILQEIKKWNINEKKIISDYQKVKINQSPMKIQ